MKKVENKSHTSEGYKRPKKSQKKPPKTSQNLPKPKTVVKRRWRRSISIHCFLKVQLMKNSLLKKGKRSLQFFLPHCFRAESDSYFVPESSRNQFSTFPAPKPHVVDHVYAFPFANSKKNWFFLPHCFRAESDSYFVPKSSRNQFSTFPAPKSHFVDHVYAFPSIFSIYFDFSSLFFEGLE